jgi:branched-chain amino acid transport system substrate-binding protein
LQYRKRNENAAAANASAQRGKNVIKHFVAAAAALFAVCGAAKADIVIGALLSTTGPSASLGIPERNVMEMLPHTIAGQTVRIVILDDASDATNAVKNAQKLITEDHVDAILGPSNTPNALAILDTIGEAQVPTITLVGSSVVIDPQEGARRWAFKLAATEAIMLRLVGNDLQHRNLKSLATIKFANAFGDGMGTAMKNDAASRGIKFLDEESYNFTDTSVTPQVLKVMSTHPDAVFIGASGTPGALPIIELRNRNYPGLIYSNQGIANPDVLRVGGKSLEGVLLPVSPVLVAEQLPDSNPIKAVSMDYINLYEGKYGPGSRSLFGATVYDAFLLLKQSIPIALKSGQPGTQAFRTALRDTMETAHEMVATQGIFSLSPKDHSGADERSQVLVRIKDGAWTLAQ